MKYPDNAMRDFKSRRESVRRYLHDHLSPNKRWVMRMMKTKQKEKSNDEVSRALYLQQKKLSDIMEELHADPIDIENYDESFTTRCGGAYRRTVGIVSEEQSKRSVTSHRQGWMNLTIVNKHGVFMIFYNKLTQSQWDNPRLRYQMNHVLGNVFTINVPPSGKINRLVHLNVTQRWYESSPIQRIVVADAAGVCVSIPSFSL